MKKINQIFLKREAYLLNLEFIKEPRLEFNEGQHISARQGITSFGVYDKGMEIRRSNLNIGAVGSAQCLDSLRKWLEICSKPIDSPVNTKQPNLFLPFCGFNLDQGFYSKFICSNELNRQIRNTDIDDILSIKNRDESVNRAIELFYEEVKFLALNRPVDVIVCILPKRLYEKIILLTPRENQEQLAASETISIELNFRRALKAKAMHLAKPLQLIREDSLVSTTKSQQDDATKAWNFCTALYYKSGATFPWKMVADSSRPKSCALGIAFYRSRDRQVLHTSLAQIFDELGNGLILRGTPINLNKNDRIPHLSSNQAYELFTTAIQEYRIALRNYPARVVLHKSSNYSAEEIDGFRQAANELQIDTVDFVTVMDSKLRLFRDGNYPPFRGSLISLDSKRHVLYTRGSVWYYQTYPGMYIPQPLDVRIVRSEESPLFLAKEILGLTKMNWNNTQFDGKYPVTLGCARKVGEIMKYLEESDKPQIRYGFYM